MSALSCACDQCVNTLPIFCIRTRWELQLDGFGQLSFSFGLVEKVRMPFAVFHPNLTVGGPNIQCLGSGILSMDGIEG